MKLALLGCTPQTLAFAQGAARLGHAVIAAYDAGGDRERLRDAIPTIRCRDDWENLLGQRDIDALIVAGPLLAEDLPADRRERRDDQLRKLVQDRLPLVVIPPVCEAIVGFELEMIRRDVSGIIIPAWSAPLHPALDQVAAQVTDKTELLSIERSLSVRSRGEILAAFALDAELFRRLSGPMKRITASGAAASGEAKPSLANLAVHIEAESGLPLRWSALPFAEFSGARLTAVGPENITLHMLEADGWRLVSPAGERRYEPHDGVARILAELSAAIEMSAEPSVSWLNACRAVEAMEAIDRSIVRGRTIELHNEEVSEQSSFKGIMAAGGCLLLLGTLAAMSCAGSLAVLFPPGKSVGDDPTRYGQFHSYWTWLQVLLIVPLALFLLAQLLSLGLSRHLRSKQASTAGPTAKTAD